jgi:hypothetical protein
MPSKDVPKKFKAGNLHSGGPNGPVVTNPKQMVAIMLSEKKNEAEHGGVYTHRNPLAGKRRKR